MPLAKREGLLNQMRGRGPFASACCFTEPVASHEACWFWFATLVRGCRVQFSVVAEELRIPLGLLCHESQFLCVSCASRRLLTETIVYYVLTALNQSCVTLVDLAGLLFNVGKPKECLVLLLRFKASM